MPVLQKPQRFLVARPAAGPAPAAPPRPAAPAAPAGPDVSGVDFAKLIARTRNAQPWTYYDTRYVGAVAIPPDAAAYNFAQWIAQTPFFQRTLGDSSYAVTNNSDRNKFDRDFVCFGIAIDVWCPPSAPSAAAVAPPSEEFIENVVNNHAFVIQFGDTPVLSLPVTECPAGGGVNYQTRVRTVLAAGAATEVGAAGNGIPDARAAKFLKKPILFKATQAFNMTLIGLAPAIAQIVGLTALAGNLLAGVRVKLIGVRAKSLADGLVADESMFAGYSPGQ